jgi:hypothetical protein
MVGKLRAALACLALSAAAGSTAIAQAQFYKFTQWELLPPPQQDAYVAGAIDTLLLHEGDPLEKELNTRYSDCILRSQLTASQIRAAILDLSGKRPELRSGAVAAAVTVYLSDLCPDLLSTEQIEKLTQRLILPPVK